VDKEGAVNGTPFGLKFWSFFFGLVWTLRICIIVSDSNLHAVDVKSRWFND
jgi:hypothetical protein